MKETHRQRLVAFLEQGNYPESCVNLSLGLDSDGYSRMWLAGKNYKAHKFALEYRLGRKLEKHEVSRHRCHNRYCVNPNHIEVGSHKDNTQDMMSSGRWKGGTTKETAVRGDNHPKAVLTDELVLEMRDLFARGLYKQKDLVRLYNVSKATVSKVIKRQTWSHI